MFPTANKDEIMFSLQKVFGKDEKFFELLEASAEAARRSAQALTKLLRMPNQRQILDEFAQARRLDKRVTEELNEELCRTFVTPLEREDIEALAAALYRIPKTIEKFGERFLLCPPEMRHEHFHRQAAILEKATDVLLPMVQELRSRTHLAKIKDQNDQLQHLEGEADKLMVTLFKDLYTGQYSPLQVIVLKDLFELLEKVIDRCRDAGNIIFHIILKYS